MDRRVGSKFNQKDPYQRWYKVRVEINSVRKALDASVINYTHSQLTYEQWATVLPEITYLINSRPLFPEGNPEDFNCISGNNLLYPYGQAFIIQPPNEEIINPWDMLKDTEKQVAKFWDI